MTPTRTQSLIALFIIIAFVVFIIVGLRANREVQNFAPRATSTATAAIVTLAPGAPGSTASSTGNIDLSCTTDQDCVAKATALGVCQPTAPCNIGCNAGQCQRTAANPTSASTTNTIPSSTGTSQPTPISNTSDGSSSSGSPSPYCQEGVKEFITKRCSGGGTTTNSNGAPTATSGIQIEGVLCWNDNGDGTRDADEYLPMSGDCISSTTAAGAAGAAATIADIRKRGAEFCAGKKSPLCAPLPTSIVVSTISPTCPSKSKGDVNCDGKIDLVDFNLWLSDFTGTPQTNNADINGDGKVSLLDFEIWRSSFVGS